MCRPAIAGSGRLVQESSLYSRRERAPVRLIPRLIIQLPARYFWRWQQFFGAPMSFYEKLKELKIELPAVATPAAAYVMFAQSGNTIFLSGHIAKKNGKPWVGQLGKNMTTEEGKLAARGVAIDLIATLQAACGGDLNRVKRIVKVMSLVNSTGDYTEQHLVTNGASDLFGEVFGEQGKHARSAFGVAQIPLGACVEIELIAEVN